MPELPEVETIKRGLAGVLPGLTITGVEITSDKMFATRYQIDGAIGGKIISVDRRAKVLLIHLDNNQSIMFHLKMTGQIIYEDPSDRVEGGHPNESFIAKMPDRTTRVIFTFDNRGHLYFNDVRRFGWIFVLPTTEVAEFPFFKTVGPEPFDKLFTIDVFAKNLLKRKGLIIKNALLDQSVVAGLGNIYADETLWEAQVHPKRLVSTLTDQEIPLLYHALRKSLETGIIYKGSSSKDYVNEKGEKGTYLDYANAYHRTGLPCNRCGQVIVREKIGGRSAHYCTHCQTL